VASVDLAAPGVNILSCVPGGGYSTKSGTSLTLPGTMSNGVIRFWTATSVTAVDITGITEYGIPFFIESLSPSQHRVDIDTEQYSNLTFVVPWAFSASTSVVSTGFDLATENWVRSCKVVVTTAGSATSNMLTFGTSTDASGFISQFHQSRTGFKIDDGLDISLAASITYLAAPGYLLLTSTTNMRSRKLHKIADSGSGARLVFKDVAGTAATAAGYIYMLLDRSVI
jgi:hypothetical protein